MPKKAKVEELPQIPNYTPQENTIAALTRRVWILECKLNQTETEQDKKIKTETIVPAWQKNLVKEHPKRNNRRVMIILVIILFLLLMCYLIYVITILSTRGWACALQGII